MLVLNVGSISLIKYSTKQKHLSRVYFLKYSSLYVTYPQCVKHVTMSDEKINDKPLGWKKNPTGRAYNLFSHNLATMKNTRLVMGVPGEKI